MISLIFGYIALYFYLVPHWGETLAAVSLCLLSLIIGVALILIAHLLKVKKRKSSAQIIPLFEKGMDQLLNTQDLTEMLKRASPTVLLGVFGAVAVASYVVFCKKKR